MVYKGHRDRGHWSVALTLQNDPELHQLLQDAVATYHEPREATAWLMHQVPPYTPERYKFTHERVLAWVKVFSEQENKQTVRSTYERIKNFEREQQIEILCDLVDELKKQLDAQGEALSRLARVADPNNWAKVP